MNTVDLVWGGPGSIHPSVDNDLDKWVFSCLFRDIRFQHECANNIGFGTLIWALAWTLRNRQQTKKLRPNSFPIPSYKESTSTCIYIPACPWFLFVYVCGLSPLSVVRLQSMCVDRLCKFGTLEDLKSKTCCVLKTVTAH